MATTTTTSKMTRNQRLLAEAAERERLRRAKEAARPTQDKRFAAIVAGLRKMANRKVREGDPNLAAKVSRCADAAEAAATEVAKIDALRRKPRKQPIADHVDAAVAELRKVLPVSFPDDEDAMAFAVRILPKTAAYRAEAEWLAGFNKLGKARAAAASTFWNEAVRAAALLSPGEDRDEMLKLAAEIGGE